MSCVYTRIELCIHKSFLVYTQQHHKCMLPTLTLTLTLTLTTNLLRACVYCTDKIGSFTYTHTLW